MSRGFQAAIRCCLRKVKRINPEATSQRINMIAAAPAVKLAINSEGIQTDTNASHLCPP